LIKKTKKCIECKERKPIINFKKNNRTKDGYISVCSDCINKKSIKTRNAKDYNRFYIYRFLDKDNNIIYVGKTVDIHSRIYSHIKKARSLDTTENEFLKYTNTYKIEYSEVESDYHMNIYEIHYICKYNPPFNESYKSNNMNLFDLPELNWKLYVLDSYKENCRLHFVLKYGKEKDFYSELKINKEFYNDLIDYYISSNILHKKFNYDPPEIMYLDDEFEENDILECCKNNCFCDEDDDECKRCKDKITWREYYNNKIKEAKNKFVK